jgi:hypothetical protein
LRLDKTVASLRGLLELASDDLLGVFSVACLNIEAQKDDDGGWSVCERDQAALDVLYQTSPRRVDLQVHLPSYLLEATAQESIFGAMHEHVAEVFDSLWMESTDFSVSFTIPGDLSCLEGTACQDFFIEVLGGADISHVKLADRRWPGNGTKSRNFWGTSVSSGVVLFVAWSWTAEPSIFYAISEGCTISAS